MKPFAHDIFISYGHLDDLNPFGQEKGWVDLLHERLLVLVGQALGYEPNIWRDGHNLQGNDQLGGAIGEGVTQSLLLIPVITPRYVQSDWCNREMEAFHAGEPPPMEAAPGYRSRVFKVVKTPLPNHLKKLEPAHIKNLIGYQFYAQDDATGLLSEFSPEPTDKLYWRMLNRLVADITKTLIELKHSSQGKTTGPLELPRGKGASGPLISAPASSGSLTSTTEKSGANGAGSPSKLVYLAETTSDLSDEREMVRDELRQRGFGVLPEQKLPLEGVKQTESAVRAALARCALSVHLVGTRYGSTPEDDARSIVRIQEQLAVDHGGANPSFLRLLWIPQALEITDERQKTFVAELQHRITAGAELLQTTIEDLKTRIVEKLSPPPPAKAPVRGAGRAPLKQVYLICENSDRSLIRPIKEYLFKQNLEVITWLDGSGADSLMDYHRKNLRECDAALVYFGSGDEPWVRKNLEDLEKAYGYGRENDWLANAVYVGAPASEQKEDFLTHLVPIVIRNFSSFDPNDLLDFVTAVKATEGGRS
ncbi:MAG TPA: TIR domain-containing protein [Pyrinomonadaceae bacterium]|nr:TIR domain-containing protein [Pyrinomonadaceae bacterium]